MRCGRSAAATSAQAVSAAAGFFIGVVVADEPADLALALEGQDVGSDAVEEPAVMGDDNGRTGKLSSASSRARRVFTSRSLVGSSSSSTLAPDLKILARWTRLRSPPDSVPTFFCWSLPAKLKRAT
jgi:hypothetical protein